MSVSLDGGLPVVRRSRGELFLDPSELTGKAVLFGFEQIQRNDTGVVRVKQLLALCGQLDALLFQLLPVTGRCFLEGVEVFQDEYLDVIPQLRGQCDGAVLPLDELLDQLDGHGLALAVGGPPHSAGADQVGVLGAPPVAGGSEHEPGPTAAAVDTPAQVVLVGSLMGPGDGVRREDVLDLLPGLGIDQRFVEPRVADAAVVDLTLVVGLPQQPVQPRRRERSAGPLGRRPGGQSAGSELFGEGAEGRVSLGVAVEGPGGQVGRIDLDGAVDSAQLVGDVHVLVADAALAIVPLMLAFWTSPLVTSLARLRE